MFDFFKKNKKVVPKSNTALQNLTPEQISILDIMDSAAADYTFPMLDNGYRYLAESRLSLFRGETDWALVFEIFGFSPRTGMPDLFVSTISNKLYNRETQENFVSEEAYSRYLKNHTYVEQQIFFPIENDEWMDTEGGEIVSVEDNGRLSGKLILRGQSVDLPMFAEFRAIGFRESDNELFVFELCRYLASEYRRDVLATPEECRVNVAPKMKQILVFDDWHHPDLADGEKPSESETFRQIASVLVTGDLSQYVPTPNGNTHWKNWPEGGTL